MADAQTDDADRWAQMALLAFELDPDALLSECIANVIRAAVAAERERCAPMWTSEAPKAAGWYWYREAALPGLVVLHIVAAHLEPNVELLAYQGPMHKNQSGRGVYVKDCPGQWCGPLVPPEVPS
jgi:hypothetical protein